MDPKKEALEAEAQLEHSRRDLKDAVEETGQKLEQLNPAQFVRRHPLAIAGAFFLIGFFLGTRMISETT
jgi:hypothetical protein